MTSFLRVFTETMAIPLDFADREALIRITTTSLSSKVCGVTTPPTHCLNYMPCLN
jgi:hypothetical protein